MPTAGSDTRPGWVRGGRREQQQQQQQDSSVQQAGTPASHATDAFASSFSAFFPSNAPPIPSGSGSASAASSGLPPSTSLDHGNYPLFARRSTASDTRTNTATDMTDSGSGLAASSGHIAVSPPFGYAVPAGPSQAAGFTPSFAAGFNTNSSRYRRPSVLATSSLAEDGDDAELDATVDLEGIGNERRFGRTGYDLDDSPAGSRLGSVMDEQEETEASALSGDDIDMDMMEGTGGGVAGGQQGSGKPSGFANNRNIIPIPGRARSMSQSSGVMAASGQFGRSPSAWPSSPPRAAFTPSANPQHMLARLTSEQHQAIAASASSASSAYFMIPAPYRQAMNNSGNGPDLLLGEQNNQAIDEDDEELEDAPPSTLTIPDTRRGSGNNKESGLARSFNPLNPYSERPPSSGKGDGFRERDQGMTMDELPAPTPQDAPSFPIQRSGFAAAGPTEPQQPLQSASSSQSSSTMLRASKSSPSLAALDASFARRGLRDSRLSTVASSMSGDSASQRIPFPMVEPPVPATPPPPNSPTTGAQGVSPIHSGLRRSQSASHRLHAPLSFPPLKGLSEKDTFQSDSLAPLTAPPISSAFRYQRANSFSDMSRLQRTNHNLKPLTRTPSDSMQGSNEADMSGSNSSGAHDMSKSDGSNLVPRTNHSSGSESPSGAPRVVRRAVNHKKGSLMPKSKDHLRTMAQLRLETGEFEVASEAALHRLSMSSAAAPTPLSTPSRRPANTQLAPTAYPSPFASLPRASSLNYGGDGNTGSSAGANATGRPTSSSGTGRPQFFQPTKNRFPETATTEDDEDDGADSSASEPDYPSAAETGFDPASASDTGGGMLMGEDEDVASNAGDNVNNEAVGLNKSAWMLRNPGQAKPLTPSTGAARNSGEMDLSPSSAIGWSGMAISRPGKRKLNDADRFEPYNTAFKRRAVSPAASTSSVSLSPLLATRDLQGSMLPAPPAGLSTLGPAAHIGNQNTGLGGFAHNNGSSVPPSPIMNTGSWLTASTSRAHSPASSVTGQASNTASRRWNEPDKDKKAVDIGKMSLE